tara:strand:- start:7 stop:384 length:378 start_codon:yes stop_codon:yes gene_type:complete
MSSSQELFDIYSWSHITHGILFYHFFSYLKFPTQQIIILSIVSEIIWEYIENTDYIIEKYRSHNFKNYKGDSYINIFGDILFSIIGIYLSYSSKSFSIFIMILLEIILSKYKANFLYLSIGSLLK